MLTAASALAMTWVSERRAGASRYFSGAGSAEVRPQCREAGRQANAFCFCRVGSLPSCRKGATCR